MESDASLTVETEKHYSERVFSNENSEFIILFKQN